MKPKFFPLPQGPWWHGWAPAAVLKVVGEDALRFLQGQFSQDLLVPAGPDRVAYGLWLNHKGRVLADSFALVHGPTEVWLVSYFSVGAEIKDHLEKHVIADDVTIEDLTADWSGLTLGGPVRMSGMEPNGEERLDAPVPPAQFGRRGPGWMFRGRRDAGECWEWLAPRGTLPPIQDERVELSSKTLESIRMEAGVPAVPVDLGPGDLPHEGGLDQVAVSYSKGCYLGQEVMARLRTGKIRRRLFRVAGAGLPPEGRPTPLFQAGRRCGELRSAVPDATGGWLGLAMLTLLGLDGTAPLTAIPEPDAPAIRLLDVP